MVLMVFLAFVISALSFYLSAMSCLILFSLAWSVSRICIKFIPFTLSTIIPPISPSPRALVVSILKLTIDMLPISFKMEVLKESLAASVGSLAFWVFAYSLGVYALLYDLLLFYLSKAIGDIPSFFLARGLVWVIYGSISCDSSNTLTSLDLFISLDFSISWLVSWLAS